MPWKHMCEIKGDHAVIHINRKKDGKTYKVLVDTDDLKKIWNCRSMYIEFKYKGAKTPYVRIYDPEGVKTYLHRYVMNLPWGSTLVVDHLNNNPLDNRKRNLNVTTQYLNSQNMKAGYGKTGIRGVYLTKDGKYQAVVTIQGKRHYLGTYKTSEEAAKVVSDFRAKHMPNSKEGREYRETIYQ